MDLRIKGRKALITGASRGIGRAVAQALAAEGAVVALTARTESGLKEVLESIGGAGDGHVVLAADLLAEGAPGRLVESIKEIGPIDMVVHVLGGALGMSDPLCDIGPCQRP